MLDKVIPKWYNTITKNKRENIKMTKTEMLNFIETTGMIVNFDRKYLMRKNKDYIKGLYDGAVVYANKKM